MTRYAIIRGGTGGLIITRGSVYHFLIIALSILMHIPDPALAQDVVTVKSEPFKAIYGFETDFNSRYVFRGFACSQGPVNQSTAWVAIS